MKRKITNVPERRRSGVLIDQLNEENRMGRMHIFERQEGEKTLILYYNVLQLHTLECGELVCVEDVKLQGLYHMIMSEPGWRYRKEERSDEHGRHAKA